MAETTCPPAARTVIGVPGRHAVGPLEIGFLPADYELEVLPDDVVDGRL